MEAGKSSADGGIHAFVNMREKFPERRFHAVPALRPRWPASVRIFDAAGNRLISFDNIRGPLSQPAMGSGLPKI
jgi:hypothetical protein